MIRPGFDAQVELQYMGVFKPGPVTIYILDNGPHCWFRTYDRAREYADGLAQLYPHMPRYDVLSVSVASQWTDDYTGKILLLKHLSRKVVAIKFVNQYLHLDLVGLLLSSTPLVFVE